MPEPSHLTAANPDEVDLGAQFASDVRYYLSLNPRQLPSRYLYDALGSALFEAICELPWYGITRAETRLLSLHAHEIMAARPFTTVIELGPGSGQKMATLIRNGTVPLFQDEPRKRGAVPFRSVLHADSIEAHLIDVSSKALATASETVASLTGVHVVAHQAPYEIGLAEAIRQRRRQGRVLTLFLGSNIGNFDPPGADAFLRSLRASLSRDDALLIGADLVKPEHELILGYDDPLGVTAAFNRNLLVRINRELGGDFDLAGFGHQAVWDGNASRVEMHLVSRSRQRVRVETADLTFTIEEGETIWTESSYKYEPSQIIEMLTSVGFTLVEQWIEGNARFALTLVEAA